jgi:hypothetical protein
MTMKDQHVGPPDSAVAGRSARTPPSTTTAVVDVQLVEARGTNKSVYLPTTSVLEAEGNLNPYKLHFRLNRDLNPSSTPPIWFQTLKVVILLPQVRDHPFAIPHFFNGLSPSPSFSLQGRK